MPAKKVSPKIIRTPYLASRSVPVPVNTATGFPASLNEETRSVEVIAATEDPAFVMDWDRWEVVREVLLMSGCQMPENAQVVLLDTHSRESVTRVLGSFRGGHIATTEKGPSLVGRTHYSTVAEGESAFIKVKERHVTDVSIGYEVLAYVWVEEGVSTTIEGKVFTGPMRVATEWAVRELSLCPIGADNNAKVRNNQQPGAAARTDRACGQNKEKTMPAKKTGGAKPAKRETLREKFRRAIGLRADEEAKKEDEARAEAELLDADGNPIDAAEIPADELDAIVDDLLDLVEEVEAELAAEEEDTDPPADGERKSARTRGMRSAIAAKFPGRKVTDRDIRAVERARIQSITRMAAAHGVADDVRDKLINDGVSLTRAKEKVLDMIENRKNEGPGFHVSMGVAEKDKFRAAVQDSLLMRCGIKIEKPAPGAAELQSYSLRETAREMVIRAGYRPEGNIMQIVGRALTSTDLPVLLIESSRRVLMDAFETSPETWRGWASTGVATDFKKSSAVGLEGDVKPRLKAEYGEYEEGKLAEVAEEYKVATYGRIMVISREAIINDDLNALSALPRLYGEQTAELVGDVVYKAFLSNPAMGDKSPLFSAKHNNIFAGSGGAPTVSKIGAMVTGMKKQKNSLGQPITVQPKYFLAPVALEVEAEQFFNTQLEGKGVVGTQASPLVHNPYGGNYFTRIYDRRLDDVSETATYLAALRGTVTAFFLGGVETPYIETDENFRTDGFEAKVRMDVGAKAMRAVTMAKGTV